MHNWIIEMVIAEMMRIYTCSLTLKIRSLLEFLASLQRRNAFFSMSLSFSITSPHFCRANLATFSRCSRVTLTIDKEIVLPSSCGFVCNLESITAWYTVFTYSGELIRSMTYKLADFVSTCAISPSLILPSGVLITISSNEPLFVDQRVHHALSSGYYLDNHRRRERE